MPDLDVRITSMYPPGVQGGIRAYASAQSPDVCRPGNQNRRGR